MELFKNKFCTEYIKKIFFCNFSFSKFEKLLLIAIFIKLLYKVFLAYYFGTYILYIIRFICVMYVIVQM